MFLNKKLKYHSVRMEYFDTENHILDSNEQPLIQDDKPTN